MDALLTDVLILVELAFAAIFVVTFFDTYTWCKALSVEQNVQPETDQLQHYNTVGFFLAARSDYFEEKLLPEQLQLLLHLERIIPDSKFFIDPFPFGLGTERPVAKFWRNLGFRRAPFFVAFLNKLWQGLLIQFKREDFGRGAGEAMLAAVNRHHPRQIVIVATGIAAELAIIAAGRLRRGSGARIILVTMGGVCFDYQGIENVDHCLMLTSAADFNARTSRSIALALPEGAIELTRARRTGKIVERELPSVGAALWTDYLASQSILCDIITDFLEWRWLIPHGITAEHEKIR